MSSVLPYKDDYHIGIITALPIERAAITAMLDEEYEQPADFFQSSHDPNNYSWGRMSKHNVVIACLAAGVYGHTMATVTAMPMLHSFPDIKFGLMVGIGAGVPCSHDVRLGDVVVSQPSGISGGVLQYDLGKAKHLEWERKDFLARPPEILLKALSKLQMMHEFALPRAYRYLSKALTKYEHWGKLYGRPSLDDKLFTTSYTHHADSAGDTCAGCDPTKIVQRTPRSVQTGFEIHYGVIASGNSLVRDASLRDWIASMERECLCIEMEAAGLMNNFPCLVIRGICDYADSHKNDGWQRYACATAAAVSKELLSFVPLLDSENAIGANEVLSETSDFSSHDQPKIELDGLIHNKPSGLSTSAMAKTSPRIQQTYTLSSQVQDVKSLPHRIRVNDPENEPHDSNRASLSDGLLRMKKESSQAEEGTGQLLIHSEDRAKSEQLYAQDTESAISLDAVDLGSDLRGKDSVLPEERSALISQPRVSIQSGSSQNIMVVDTLLPEACATTAITTTQDDIEEARAQQSSATAEQYGMFDTPATEADSSTIYDVSEPKDTSYPVHVPTDSGYATVSIDGLVGSDTLQDEDSATVYTNFTLPGDQKSGYQALFVYNLLGDCNDKVKDEKMLDRISEILPDLLWSFALQLGIHSSLAQGKDAMVFVIKYRNHITQSFREEVLDSKRRAEHAAQTVSWRERMSLLGLRDTYQAFELNESELSEQNSVFGDYQAPAGLTDAIDLVDSEIVDDDIDIDYVLKSPAYAWLIAEINKRLHLSFPETAINTFADIRKKLALVAPRPQIVSRYTKHQIHSITFHTDWSPSAFVERCGSNRVLSGRRILEKYLTLTSNGDNIQALTCKQYLTQTWPVSGQYMYRLLEDIMAGLSARLVVHETLIKGLVEKGRLSVQVEGQANFIMDVGEQLAWISSALAVPEDEVTPQYCTAEIRLQTQDNSALKQPSHSSWQVCNIHHSSRAQGASSGNECWRRLFSCLTVASGFPVVRRPDSIPGLEISLGVLLTLLNASHICKINHQITIKGFSSMLTLTDRQVGTSVWHMSGSTDGPFISYEDAPQTPDFTLLDVHEITADRHFVGWCKSSSYGIGSMDSNYEIEESGLWNYAISGYLGERRHRRPHRFDQEPVFIAQTSNRPQRTPKASYVENLRWLHKKAVVLWDTGTQRGWLTNGTSALLHLVLTSLNIDSKDVFHEECCFDKNAIMRSGLHTATSSANILTNETNLNLKTTNDDSGSFTLRRRVEDIFQLLRAMIEEQISLQAHRRTINFLEGWDFRDIADTGQDPIRPRSLQLLKDCSGWANLIKDTTSLILFGRNFGELFTPIEPDSCKYWATVPSGLYYLAAVVPDLRWIMVSHGNRFEQPQRLSSSTTWTVLSTTFEKCKCDTKDEHSNLVQILVPTSEYIPPSKVTHQVSAPEGGAVIFGEITDCRWFKSGNKPLWSDNVSVVTELSTLIDSAPQREINTSSGPARRKKYFIAVVCALDLELRALRCLYDERHESFAGTCDDPNQYALGRIGQHNIVAACLPKGKYGNRSATVVATHLLRSFPEVSMWIMVGIGGGIPASWNDVRLGDVVVSCPEGEYAGIIEYDFEKVMQDSESVKLGSLYPPPDALLKTISNLTSDPEVGEDALHNYLSILRSLDARYAHPKIEDRLYVADYKHQTPETSCTACNGPTVSRTSRPNQFSQIHYGLIASGDKLIKDANARDTIGRRYRPLCFEMEAAGIANDKSCLVIRGICDYADSHKNKAWQNYASACAAAYAKLLLSRLGGFSGKHAREES